MPGLCNKCCLVQQEPTYTKLSYQAYWRDAVKAESPQSAFKNTGNCGQQYKEMQRGQLYLQSNL